MSDTFAKLASKIITSTVWQLDDQTRLVWITMLAMKDKDHIVTSSIPGLAHAARVPVEDCRRALAILSSPDKDSGSNEDDGRRIQPVENGWFVINGEKYRWFGAKEEKREMVRARVAMFRERYKALHGVTGNKKKRRTRQAEAEARVPPLVPPKGGKAQPPTIEEVSQIGQSIGLTVADCHACFHYHNSRGWLLGKAKVPMKDLRSTIITWKQTKERISETDKRAGQPGPKQATFYTTNTPDMAEAAKQYADYPTMDPD